ncbi:hypothetical protein EHQ23_02325 [Leptospira bourretii]|uniref:Uncharacterized protein n=1 Tax=Leptospira bourretii TaxID=2484962 RepID=A0A4R9IML3_9LEPT|nr:hypothetical protein [Leptospira bourretii]TGK89972.1 hypothetical protein EHQ23_02325 [Leptospira bourretii]TGK92195.1 hypothetical protein EHQ26_09470 [Leptospira bourretii]TGL36220.1 hypothetical protein EHQ45_07300 [Leptospira bourretii]
MENSKKYFALNNKNQEKIFALSYSLYDSTMKENDNADKKIAGYLIILNIISIGYISILEKIFKFQDALKTQNNLSLHYLLISFTLIFCLVYLFIVQKLAKSIFFREFKSHIIGEDINSLLKLKTNEYWIALYQYYFKCYEQNRILVNAKKNTIKESEKLFIIELYILLIITIILAII